RLRRLLRLRGRARGAAETPLRGGSRAAGADAGSRLALSACPKGHTRFRPSSTLVETGLLSMRFRLERGASPQEGESGGEPAGPRAVDHRLRLRSAPVRPRRRV